MLVLITFGQSDIIARSIRHECITASFISESAILFSSFFYMKRWRHVICFPKSQGSYDIVNLFEIGKHWLIDSKLNCMKTLNSISLHLQCQVSARTKHDKLQVSKYHNSQNPSIRFAAWPSNMNIGDYIFWFPKWPHDALALNWQLTW
jgi:hypothetical protein